MKQSEFTGKTVEEAKAAALAELGVDEDQVEFTVLKKGRSSILGMGGGEAKVLARFKENTPESNDAANEAKKVLETLVEHLNLDAKVKILPPTGDNGPVTLNLEGEDLGVLIGRRGQTLASLQYIVRLIVSEKTKVWPAINVDVAGYKKRRYEALNKLAFRLAEQVKTTRRSINLEPMPPDERRAIHIALANHPDVTTQSIDEGEKRKVVIMYKKH